MVRSLPHLDWLRVFDACAATESFATAATALGVTPGAVSQRIKSLEAYLGIALFQRHPQGVRLTEAGKRYAKSVHVPLRHLADATRDLASIDAGAPVRITILPALAQLWLGPRMEQFHQRFEGASVEIWADPAVIDLGASNFDLAIRYGRPPFAGCDHHPLLVDEIVPVASPTLIKTAERDAHGLPLSMPLMVDSYWASDFDDWLRHSGLTRPAHLTTQSFSLYSMAVEATVGGRGFMMGHTSLLSDLIAQGKLACLSNRKMPAAHQFYLLTRSKTPVSKSAATFIDWLLGR